MSVGKSIYLDYNATTPHALDATHCPGVRIPLFAHCQRFPRSESPVQKPGSVVCLGEFQLGGKLDTREGNERDARIREGDMAI